jgi:hypothetical protein
MEEFQNKLKKFHKDDNINEFIRTIIYFYYYEDEDDFGFIKSKLFNIFYFIIYSPFWKDKERLKKAINNLIVEESIMRKKFVSKIIEIENDHNHYSHVDYSEMLNKLIENIKFIYFVKKLYYVQNYYNSIIDEQDFRGCAKRKIIFYIYNILFIV